MHRKIIPWLLPFFLCSSSAEKSTVQPPNVVLIFIDDMGWGDVSFNNPGVDYTPSFTYLAQHGLQLNNFYVSQAVCTASRASLMTGCYTNRVGLSGAMDHNSRIGLHPDETTIADMLKKKGYATAAYGKWHLGHHPAFLPTRQGFDDYYGIPYSNDMWPYHPERPGSYPPLPLYENEKVIDTITEQSWMTKRFTEKAIGFIEQHKQGPFFLYLAHPMPHVPLYVSAEGKGRTGKGLYADVIHEIDASVGAVLQSLRENNLEKNTLVIVTSDNGPWLSYGNHAGSTAGLREGKGTSWEGGVREPCVMYWKDVLPAGKVFDHAAMTIDILPTIAAVTGAPLPEKKIDGINLWPYLVSLEKKVPDRPLFFYYNRDDLEAMRWKNWKLYFPHRYRTMNGQTPGKDGLPGNYRMIDMKEIELYDLGTDMYEQQDIAPLNPAVVKEMQKLADDIRVQLGDDLTGVKGTENREPGRLN